MLCWPLLCHALLTPNALLCVTLTHVHRYGATKASNEVHPLTHTLLLSLLLLPRPLCVSRSKPSLCLTLSPGVPLRS